MVLELDIYMLKKKKKKGPDKNLTPFTNINWKWITDFNVKNKSIKLLKDNKGGNLDDLEYGDFFFIKYQRHYQWKKILIKLNFIQIKSFCSVRDNIKRMKRQPQTRRKYLQKTYLIKDYYPKSTKTFKNQQ